MDVALVVQGLAYEAVRALAFGFAVRPQACGDLACAPCAACPACPPCNCGANAGSVSVDFPALFLASIICLVLGAAAARYAARASSPPLKGSAEPVSISPVEFEAAARLQARALRDARGR